MKSFYSHKLHRTRRELHAALWWAVEDAIRGNQSWMNSLPCHESLCHKWISIYCITQMFTLKITSAPSGKEESIKWMVRENLCHAHQLHSPLNKCRNLLASNLYTESRKRHYKMSCIWTRDHLNERVISGHESKTQSTSKILTLLIVVISKTHNHNLKTEL